MEQALRVRLELSRARVSDTLAKALEVLENCEQAGATLLEITRIKHELNDVTSKLKEEILRYIDKVADVSTELVRDCTELELKADKANSDFSLLVSENVLIHQQQHEQPSCSNSAKLPKLQLPTFDGNILKWHDFWDQFEASVHAGTHNDALKMAYLVASLKGPALDAIEGLGSTNKNYGIAVETLKRRFGNKQYVIDAHYNALHRLDRAKDDPNDCRRVLNNIEKNLRVLQSLGEDTTSNAFRTILLNQFPERVIFQLNIAIRTDGTVSTIREQLDNIITAMELSQGRSDTLLGEKPTCSTEALHVRTSLKPNLQSGSKDTQRKWYNTKPGPSRNDKRPIKRKYTEETDYNKKKICKVCIFCDGGHYNDECDIFKSIEERIQKLSDKCFKCFAKGHLSKQCRKEIVCRYCSGPHNRALCRKKMLGMNATVTSECTTTVHGHNRKTFLQTAIARVLSRSGSRQLCRILMDSGSQRSYMTSRLAHTLSITPIKEDLLMIYTFGSERPMETLSPSAEIILQTKRGMQRKIQVNIVPSITDRIPVPDIPLSEMVDMIADDGSGGQGIDILIGNDYYFSFIKGNMIKVDEESYLVDTDFGWIISGRVDIGDDKDTLAVVTYHQCDPGYSYFTEPDLPLRNMDIKFLWTLENIGITDSAKTTREDEAVHHFNNTVRYHEGRYFVKWPWTQYPPALPTNYGLAYGRLKGLLQRSDFTTLQEYDKILKEQCDSGIIEMVDMQLDAKHQTMPPIHYLPHHIVKQVGKRGRIVYDASAKLKDQQSLNECLYRGPCMLPDLTALLVNFRTSKIGILADVEKAFLQVGLQSDDRDVTRFLWVKDITKPLSDENLIHLRFCRVPFGIISSPFLLTATIRYHFSKMNENLLERIADKCYVDNLVTGANTTQEAFKVYTETRTVFQELSMNIRDWTSNDKSLMDTIPDQCIAKQIERVTVLGLLWNVEEDSLQLKVNEAIFDEQRLVNANKREVLRILASIYDPCGFVSPLTMPAKLLLQELWRRKCKWETTLPEDLLSQWKDTVAKLRDIENVKLPRHLGCVSESKEAKYEMHCFTDASQNSYAAVAYLRAENANSIQVTLLMSKARVAPLKDKENLKIPRLELLGYLIGSRLLTYLRKTIVLPQLKQYLWTDSLIVLNWTQSKKLLPPFIARRVEEIKQNTEVRRCYINTDQNPADLPTRPETWTQKKDIWFHGPAFLAKDKVSWPKNIHLDDHLMSLSAVAEDLDAAQPEYSEDVHSDQVETFQSEPHRSSYSQEIINLQLRHFPEEVKGKETHLVRNLGLFKDVEGILRCKGRLMHADLSYETKHPILLPKDCEFTTKVIKETHEENYHVGVPHTLSIVRQKYWISQGRIQVQKVIRRCPQCVKHGGGPYRLPETPALPVERVRYTTPYTYTGLDYFGPMYVKMGNNTEKRWICLFTCLVVRAVHLEIVRDLTAEECLLALGRFVASRGLPSHIMSDNALQFKLTSEVLKSEYCTKNKIKWKFIPQLAPWHGGVYERLVAVVKHCLKRTLEKHVLSDNQLLTVMKEVEAVVNTRPLTYVGADMGHILRPADFLSLGRCLTLDLSIDQSIPHCTITKENLIEGWRRGQKVMKDFKNMFVGQYLLNLRERYRQSPRQPRVTSQDTPNVGDIVQLKGESKNREQWKVGQISELITGPDGEIRVAKVRVGNTDFTRSIGHLYPLEADIICDRLDSTLDTPNIPESPDASTSIDPDHSTAYPHRVQETMEVEQLSKELCVGREKGPSQDLMEIEHEEPVETNPASQVTDGGSGVQSAARPTHDEPETQEERPRREAAIRARERIAVWTRQLIALLHI